jgi:hypothetical protein
MSDNPDRRQFLGRVPLMRYPPAVVDTPKQCS